jgi:hypothetical protein
MEAFWRNGQKSTNMYGALGRKHFTQKPCRHDLVIASQPNTLDTGAMGREIESHQSIGW